MTPNTTNSLALTMVILFHWTPALLAFDHRTHPFHSPNRNPWTEINPAASWAPRAGLQVVQLRNTFFLMGGRTPIDPAVLPVPGASVIWSDVWARRDFGRSWRQLVGPQAPGHWPARAYFQVQSGSQERLQASSPGPAETGN